MEDSSITGTIQTPADTAADEATEVVQAEEFLYLDPADIIIGTNVRTDLRADHKEFRKSIKERGVPVSLMRSPRSPSSWPATCPPT